LGPVSVDTGEAGGSDRQANRKGVRFLESFVLLAGR